MQQIVRALDIEGEVVRPETSLTDVYVRDSAHVYMTGMQAIVRSVIAQAQRDRAAGLTTSGYVSGYRGSPLGGVDLAMIKARKHLEENSILFQPGLNEDLAATAIWGTQQVGLYEKPKVEGVFGLWYGKGPGVDRSGDVLKHGNLAGSSAKGGVLVLTGDDHMAKSSTTAHQSEPTLIAFGIPVLSPASVDELLRFSIYGYALSRFSGCWIGQKCSSDIVDSSASFFLNTKAIEIVLPTDVEMPPDGLNIRRTDTALKQEERLERWKLPAVRAFTLANRLDRITHDAPRRRIGVVTAGRPWMDVVAALKMLGLNEPRRQELGVAVYKVGVPWPLAGEGLKDFAAGCEEIIILEEKRAIIEEQASAALYSLAADRRPAIVGKRDPEGRPFLPSFGEFDAALVARAIGARLVARGMLEPAALDRIKPGVAGNEADIVTRAPWFCAGCPHNTSTRLPEGSITGGGIGCHGLAVWNDAENTLPFSHMGGEGANWIGRSPFVETPHMFQNLGDGTYNHSGILAIRAAVAAGVNITYKIFFNDAVAMTGGQAHEGGLTADRIAEQLRAEGVQEIAVVADDPQKYAPDVSWPAGVRVHPRDELDAVQRRLRDIPGVTALIYDQVCATERRRRRKRGTAAKSDTRVFINDLVCEGCGDCGRTSNCVAVQPIETMLGRKRTIDQSACNQDFSCLKGFCPSFVTVTGGEMGELPKPGLDRPLPDLRNPSSAPLAAPYGILITGIGGTGVVTLAALMGMAAHLDGKAARVMDQTGMAQKNGAVTSHVLLGPSGATLPARLTPGELDLLLGCDLVGAAAQSALKLVRPGQTRAVVNTHVTPVGPFTRQPDLDMGESLLMARVQKQVGPEGLSQVDAVAAAKELFGDSVLANLFLLGFAWQQGLIPLTLAALFRAIELNGVAVDLNKAAFSWGRVAVAEPQATPAAPRGKQAPADLTLDELIEARTRFLTEYQSRGYARRFQSFVEQIRQVETARAAGSEVLARAVCEGLFRLMSYKDEYEVARLLTDPEQLQRIRRDGGKGGRLEFHMAPPLLARSDPRTGRPAKVKFGPWLLPVLRALKHLKVLRGTPFDLFGYSQERRTERRMIADYMRNMTDHIRDLDRSNLPKLVEIAELALLVRGYGHIKEANRIAAETKYEQLKAALSNPDAGRQARAA